ncbi:ABC transporter permease subunit [Synechococcus sp. PCC 7336]|uniref:carbohydrate ABC transporter permease n=1 Tax=Synechococcus sp. PCC 7336 TaxID=195250 RepID=UPI000347AE76
MKRAIWTALRNYWLLVAIAIVAVGPILWLFSTALKSPSENIFAYPPQLIPQAPTLENFGRVWRDNPFPQYLWNSSVVSAIAVVCNLLFCSLAAYPLARLEFRGKSLIFWGIVGTSAIPFQITMIPLYVLAVQLNLKNTYLGLVFPYATSAFGIFLLRQAFQTVPLELEEAARIDGCSPIGIWWNVMLPSIRSALTTLAIFTFVGMWGDFLWPLVMLDDPQRFTLPLGVANLASAFSADWRAIAAGSILSILPVLGFFAALQQFIIPSESGSGIKG